MTTLIRELKKIREKYYTNYTLFEVPTPCKAAFKPFRRSTFESFIKDICNQILKILVVFGICITNSFNFLLLMLFGIYSSVSNFFQNNQADANESYEEAKLDCVGIFYFALHAVIDTLWQMFALVTRIGATLELGITNSVSYFNFLTHTNESENNTDRDSYIREKLSL